MSERVCKNCDYGLYASTGCGFYPPNREKGCNHFKQKCDSLGLLKKQPEIVRCKDCRRYYANGGNCDQVLAEWYCADGERKDESISDQ